MIIVLCCMSSSRFRECRYQSVNGSGHNFRILGVLRRKRYEVHESFGTSKLNPLPTMVPDMVSEVKSLYLSNFHLFLRSNRISSQQIILKDVTAFTKDGHVTLYSRRSVYPMTRKFYTDHNDLLFKN